MNLCIINFHHSAQYNFIDKPESFRQYHHLILPEHKGTNIQTSTTQVINSKLYGVSKDHVFADITTFTYIISVNFNVKCLMVEKTLKKVLVFLL